MAYHNDISGKRKYSGIGIKSLASLSIMNISKNNKNTPKLFRYSSLSIVRSELKNIDTTEKMYSSRKCETYAGVVFCIFRNAHKSTMSMPGFRDHYVKLGYSHHYNSSPTGGHNVENFSFPQNDMVQIQTMFFLR